MSFARRTGMLTVAVVLAAGVGAYYEHRASLPADGLPAHVDVSHPRAAQTMGTEDGARMRPDFVVNDLDGNPQRPEQWDGQIVLYNFWAAWCPPCRREIPVFNEVRDFYHPEGFEVVGIAIDERDAVVKFLGDLGGVDYPQLIGVAEGTQAMGDFGNASGGLPYSVLVDAKGRVRYVKQGELEKDDLIREVEKLLAEARAGV